MKILIAEDSLAFRRLLKETLDRWEYEVVVTNDGVEAWQAILDEGAPQVAILDWMMPGMNGLELCRKIRNKVDGPYIYIILLTSQHQDDDIVSGMEAGADDYIIKPYKINELRVRLNAGKRMIEVQNKLAASVSSLQYANRELEAFSYTVSHDLRSPLVWISGYCRSILKYNGGRLEEESRKKLVEVCAGIQRMEQLIDALLGLSYSEDQSELTLEPLDVSEMAQGVADELILAGQKRQVTFNISDNVFAIGDKRLVKIVMENLLNNAWKYTGELDDAIIEFGVTKENGVPTYFVHDNGAGFDMTVADKLFTPFQRFHDADRFKGYGIGLATVKRIITRHNGKIWAQSMVGTGTTFYFTLKN